MYRMKIFGAGSIGNHLAHAARTFGWEVLVCDLDPAALTRMREQIYPGRYGAWDDAISLRLNSEGAGEKADIVFIGTPPESHLPLALEALTDSPRAIIIEKPVCPPSLDHADELYRSSRGSRTRVYVGYDHVVGKAARKVEEILASGVIGRIQTIDVDFREHWGGIFAAHPWLSGPTDSYLGYWQRGGGASGEHSHAMNLWQHFAHVVGAGRVVEVDAMLRYTEIDGAEFDDLCLLNLRTETGMVGRVVQDVVTRPHRKRATIQGEEGAVEWLCNYDASGDAVRLVRPGQESELIPIPKRRPDDFIQELAHIADDLESSTASSPLAIERGLDTALVIAAAHLSEKERCRVRIDYSKGYLPAALTAGA